MRTALITFLKTEDRVIRGETGRFQKFDGDVKTAVAAFTAAEQGNTDELARILAQMESGQGGSGSVSAPPPQTSGGSSASGVNRARLLVVVPRIVVAHPLAEERPQTRVAVRIRLTVVEQGAASGTSSADQAPVQNKPSEF